MTTQATEAHVVSDSGLGYSLPHKMGDRLWGPMFVMALMAFPIALVLAFVRASEVSSVATSEDVETIARLGHLVAAFGFIGFAAVFAAISFAVARILGRFRKGGGEVQEVVGGEVHTLRMPLTARIFMAFMAMGMMTIIVAVILHFVAAAAVGSWALESVARWAEVLEGVRRLGVGLYLFGITFGLGTIITVVRFQTSRIGHLAR